MHFESEILTIASVFIFGIFNGFGESICGSSIAKMSAAPFDLQPGQVSISPLLQKLAYPSEKLPVEAVDIASAFALIFEDRLSAIQTAALLTLLHSTGRDRDAEVIARCSHRMREAATQVDRPTLKKIIKARGKKEGTYNGGLVRIAIGPQLIKSIT